MRAMVENEKNCNFAIQSHNKEPGAKSSAVKNMDLGRFAKTIYPKWRPKSSIRLARSIALSAGHINVSPWS